MDIERLTGEEVCQRWWREEGGLLCLVEFWRERDGRTVIAKGRFVGGAVVGGRAEEVGEGWGGMYT